MSSGEHIPELRFESVEVAGDVIQVVHVEGDSLPTYEVIMEPSSIISRTDITVTGPMKIEDDGSFFLSEPSGSVELRAHGAFDQKRVQAVAGDLTLLLRKHLLPQQPPTAAPGEAV